MCQAEIRCEFNLQHLLYQLPEYADLLKQFTWQPTDAAEQRHSVDVIDCPAVVRDAGPGKGLGAFASRQLAMNEPIGEYAGLVIRGDDAECRDFLFDLQCCGLVVDASLQGNLTRFINHAGLPRNNVYAAVVVAGGARKVRLWTTRVVKEGEELLLNYGFTEESWV